MYNPFQCILQAKNLLLIPGGILCGASFLCGGAVGAGDGLMLAVLGLCRGGVRAVGEAFLALILLILWGMIQIRRKKLTAKTPIAYLPFLWLADGIFVLADIGQRTIPALTSSKPGTENSSSSPAFAIGNS